MLCGWRLWTLFESCALRTADPFRVVFPLMENAAASSAWQVPFSRTQVAQLSESLAHSSLAKLSMVRDQA